MHELASISISIDEWDLEMSEIGATSFNPSVDDDKQYDDSNS
jgi:hypothetical protein